MFQSVLHKLKLGDKSNVSTIHSSLSVDGCLGEKEEDGFLIIGETARERDTVTHQEFMRQATQSPPSYSDVTTSEGRHTMINLPELSPLTDNRDYMTGVPFQLSQHLTQFNRLNDTQDDYTLVQFNWTKYDYDFQFELDYLKEIGSPYVTGQAEEARNLIQL